MPQVNLLSRWTIQVTYNGGVYIRDEQGREMAYTDNKKAAEEIIESVNSCRASGYGIQKGLRTWQNTPILEGKHN